MTTNTPVCALCAAQGKGACNPSLQCPASCYKILQLFIKAYSQSFSGHNTATFSSHILYLCIEFFF